MSANSESAIHQHHRQTKALIAYWLACRDRAKHSGIDEREAIAVKKLIESKELLASLMQTGTPHGVQVVAYGCKLKSAPLPTHDMAIDIQPDAAGGECIRDHGISKTSEGFSSTERTRDWNENLRLRMFQPGGT